MISSNIARIAAVAVSSVIATTGLAQSEADSTFVLITDARIFDGVSEALIEDQDVLIQDGMIAQVGPDIDAPDGAQIIDADGRVMTPGLIYMHEHLGLQVSAPEVLFGDEQNKALVSAHVAKLYLMNGITTVRDAQGNVFSLKGAIDRGLAIGPRIYPSGTMISQTSGHADHRTPTQPSLMMGGTHDAMVLQGDSAVADGVPEVLRAVRETLRRGSSQIKIAVGGGTGSISDPLEVIEYTAEEIRAATQAAEDFGTYVMAHVYNSAGIQRAIENGVKSIEHGNLMDRETMQMMKDNDVWLSSQVTVYSYIPEGYTPGQADKHRQAYAGIAQMYETAKEIGYDNLVFGSDIINDLERVKTINNEFTFRAEWFTPAELLRMATSKGGELLAKSNVLNPYPGALGVIAEGAHADLLLIDGNPLEDIAVMTNPDDNFDLIMKGGVIFKDEM